MCKSDEADGERFIEGCEFKWERKKERLSGRNKERESRERERDGFYILSWINY